LATDTSFVQALAERNGRGGKAVNIYLQFDGFKKGTHRAIRGKDLRERKRAALDNCADAGLTVTLVAAIEKDLNSDELGAIIRYGIEHPAVRSVAFQPVTHSGRHIEFDPMTRLTNSDIIHGIAAQLPEWFRASDFFPVPCCFPTCRSITYLIVDQDEETGATTVVPIPRLIQIEDYLDYVTNRVLPDERVRAALEKLWSASAFMGTGTTADQLQLAAQQLDCAACGLDLPQVVKEISDKSFMIVIQDFQDPYTLNVRTLMKCCVEEITPDGRLIPFCAYNSVGYREQVREQMSGVAVADVVPNANQLQALVRPSPYGSRIARTSGGQDVAIARDATNVGRSLR
jgi:hypothetical protein